MEPRTVERSLSEEEYMLLGRKSATKYEYQGGHVFAMAGASRKHVLIKTNIICELANRLKGKPCEVYTSNMRVRSTGLYTYPDVSVVCGHPQFYDGKADTLLNPTVLVEVLSSSTEGYDRGEKFMRYRDLRSLQEYVLISQDGVHVERFRRMGDLWIMSELNQRDDMLRLESIDCELPLGEIYYQVEVDDSFSVPN